MKCYCCATQMALARKVKLRPWQRFETNDSPDSTAFLSRREEMAYRWAVVCQECYRKLDNEFGSGGCGDFELAASSRGAQAAIVHEG
jgi:hypothetical protein